MEILNIKQDPLRRISVTVLIALCFGAGISCRKQDSTVELPKVDPKLVIVSFISPQDTLIRVSVSMSQPLYNNAESKEYKPVENAEVIISGNGISARLVYNPQLKEYTALPSQLSVSEGVVYIVSVSTPDGKKASASTTIPSANASLSYTYLPSSYSLATQWTDLSAGEDYYRLMVQYSSFYIFESFSNGTAYSDTIYTHGIQYDEFFLDRDYSSPTLSKNIPLEFSEGSENKMYLYLLHVSKEYYDYTKKLYTSEVNGSPFQEPSIMYTNVSGGFGVFAGYNNYRMEINP